MRTRRQAAKKEDLRGLVAPGNGLNVLCGANIAGRVSLSPADLARVIPIAEWTRWRKLWLTIRSLVVLRACIVFLRVPVAEQSVLNFVSVMFVFLVTCCPLLLVLVLLLVVIPFRN